MAKFDQGGGCPCGRYRECEPKCEQQRVAQGAAVVWVVGPKWQTVRECMFFGDEQRARDCAAAMKRFAPDKFRDVAVFAVEVVG